MSILREIRNGLHDEFLQEIQEEVVRRRQVLGRMQFAELAVGSRVRFVQTIRPTYLRGMEATVVGKKVSKLMVRLDRPVGRFRGDIRVPAALIEPVDNTSSEGGEAGSS